jgi:hypothetical protein
MSTLEEVKASITESSNWISEALNSSAYKADFLIESLKEVDRFFNEHSKDGKPVAGGLLETAQENKFFALGSYLGEVIRRKTGGEWIVSKDPAGKNEIALNLSDGRSTLFPISKIKKRFLNGESDLLFPYASFITSAQYKDNISKI